MSNTTMYSFDTDGDMGVAGDYANGWRSGPMLWDYLLVKLKLIESGEAGGALKWGLLFGGDPKADPFASLLGTKPLTADEKGDRDRRQADNEAAMSDDEWWAYSTTLDRCVIDANCAGELIEALRMVQTKIEAFNAGKDRITPSFAEQAETIVRETDVEPATTGLRGFAWNQTSVSDTWPLIPITDEGEVSDSDDDDHDYASPNLDRDGAYHFITGLRKSEYVEAKH